MSAAFTKPFSRGVPSNWPIWLLLLAAALALALLPLPLALAMVAAITFALALLIWPVLGLYALIIAIPFSAILRLPLGPTSIGVTDLLVAATTFAWFLQHATHRSQFAIPNLKPTPLLWLLLPFAIALLYSTLAAQSLEQAIPELVKWAEVIIIYFLGTQLLDERQRLPFVGVVLAAASIEALIGLRQFVFRIGPEAFELGRYLRAYGSFGQPNPYAGYLGLTLPLALAITLWATETALRPQLPSRLKLQHAAIACISLGFWLIIAAGIVASWSRAAWLGVVLSTLAVLALYSLSGRLLILLGGIFLIIAYPILPAGIVARLSDVFIYFGTWNARAVVITDQNFSVLERVAHWQAAWEMFADNIWLGIGVGNWDEIYPRYLIDPWFDAMGHAHNVLFHYAAVAGLFGLFTYLWLWIGSLVAAFIAVIRNTDLNRAIAIGVFGLLVHLSIHNQLDNLWVQGMPLLVALALSLLLFPVNRKDS